MKNSAQTTIYQTGSTTPPKNYSGLITFLIVLVILLCGVISALGMMNIRLFQIIKAQNTAPETAVAFSGQPVPAERSVPGFGVTVREVDDLYQDYYDWPKGLYISNITPGSPAELAKLRCGDIIQAVNNTLVSTENELLTQISGDTLLLTVYRDGATLTLPVTVTEAD